MDEDLSAGTPAWGNHFLAWRKDCGQQKRRPKAASLLELAEVLQRRFNLKSPGLEKGLRDVFGVLVTARPLAEASRPDVLVRGQLELLGDLLERGDCRHNRANRLGLSPVRVSTTLCH